MLCAQRQSFVAAAETTWATKPKVFTTWTFVRGRVLLPILCCHVAINLSQPLSWPRLRNRLVFNVCYCVVDIMPGIAVSISAGTEADTDPFTSPRLPLPHGSHHGGFPVLWWLACISSISLETLVYALWGPVYLEITPRVCPWLYSLLMGSGKENWLSHSQGMHTGVNYSSA